ncbi:MAG: aldehyde dehydrogenase, partial [Actinobacteria bacterium]
MGTRLDACAHPIVTRARPPFYPRASMDTAYLDDAVADLAANKQSFATAPVREKIAMLGRLRERTGLMARGWVQAATRAKGIAMDSPFAGEEWTSGPYALAAGINALETTLRRIAEGRHVLDGLPVSTRGDGRVVVRVFPADAQDRVFFSGHRADVWMQPGVTEATLGDTVASFYRKRHPEGAVALVLGAGNIASIPPLDALYRMLVHGNVAIVKLNPVNDYLGPIYAEIFADFIDRGFLRIFYGGNEAGAAILNSDNVDTVHITGSASSHDQIVYGSGPEAAERRRLGQPLLGKPITSELGGVSPFIVVPGPWSEADLRYQAEHFVTQKILNGGFNCVAAQVLVLA